jgi:hypothetical protein
MKIKEQITQLYLVVIIFIPSNVKYVIRADQINYLDGDIHKASGMEEIVIEKNVDLEIILEKIQIKMTNLTIANQRDSGSRNVDKRGIGGIFQGVIPDVRNDLATTQETKQKIEISQMNRSIWKMQNELTRLR